MNKLIKNSFYTTAWLFLSTQNTLISFATTPGATFWQDKTTVDNDLQQWTADNAIQNMVDWLFWFLYLIAVLFILWGGFLILTAAWDDEKVSKWKTILIQRAIWLLVIFIAWAIVNWIIDLLASWWAWT